MAAFKPFPLVSLSSFQEGAVIFFIDLLPSLDQLKFFNILDFPCTLTTGGPSFV
jgi:hypothetical protein